MFERIKQLRKENDFTQKEISEILDCSQQVYSNYELGQRDIPTSVLMKLSIIYNVSTDYILGLTGNPEKNK
ncbi:MAG: helix-turn-helix transcriptional regulator [Ruminococcus sp.]|nr:helix-turn-helix transcriptional regulator [Candidatus Copronaster equi]